MTLMFQSQWLNLFEIFFLLLFNTIINDNNIKNFNNYTKLIYSMHNFAQYNYYAS